MRRLVGPNDAHLALIEDALDVTLVAPGGAVTISGAPASRDTARRVLRSLFRQLTEGRTVEEAEVRAALRIDATNGSAGAANDGVIQIGPRKSFKARTAKQIDYVRALADTQAGLVFGVGPAGTG